MRGGSEKIQEDLLRALHEFTVIQGEHLELFKKGKLARIGQWRMQQAKAAVRLKHCFDEYNKAGLPEEDREFHEDLRKRIADALEGGRSLSLEVEDRKERVHGQICKLRKGKRVVKGYSMYGTAQTGPKYLSSRR